MLPPTAASAGERSGGTRGFSAEIPAHLDGRGVERLGGGGGRGRGRREVIPEAAREGGAGGGHNTLVSACAGSFGEGTPGADRAAGTQGGRRARDCGRSRDRSHLTCYRVRVEDAASMTRTARTKHWGRCRRVVDPIPLAGSTKKNRVAVDFSKCQVDRRPVRGERRFILELCVSDPVEYPDPPSSKFEFGIWESVPFLEIGFSHHAGLEPGWIDGACPVSLTDCEQAVRQTTALQGVVLGLAFGFRATLERRPRCSPFEASAGFSGVADGRVSDE